MGFDFLYEFVRNVSDSKNNSARYCLNSYTFSCEVPVIFLRIESNLIVLDRFSKKNLVMSNCMKIRTVEAELLYADGQTGRRTNGMTLRS